MRAFYSFVLSLLVLTAFAPNEVRAQVKTLKRKIDPVVLSGEPLESLWGSKLAGLRLMAVRGGKLETIPFQTDKRDPDERYIIPAASVPREVVEEAGFDNRPESEKRSERIKKFEKKAGKYRKQVKKGEMTQAELDALRAGAYHEERLDELDYNDELVFMARDGGDKLPRDQWPVSKGIEIQVADPIDGGQGWVYFLDFEGAAAPVLSTEDYVSYKADGDIVESRLMRLDFVDDKPLILEAAYPRDGKGKELYNIIDRFKMRIHLEIRLFFCGALNFDENNIRAFTVGYVDGPVRVLRRNVFWIVMGGIKLPFVPQALVYYTFYGEGLYGPTEIQVPFDPKYLLCAGSTAGGGLDFRQSMDGARAYTARNRDGSLLFDSRTSTEETTYIDLNERWASVVKEEDDIGFIVRVVYGPRLAAAGVNNTFEFIDDPKKRMEPENEPGARWVGFGVNVQEVPAGTFNLWFYMYVSGAFQHGDEQQYLNVADNPLVIAVK